MEPFLPTARMVDEVSCLFGALGDRSRLRILRVLMEATEPLCQGKVADASGLSQANASKHLACLVRVGLVERQPKGNTVFFAPVLPLVQDLCSMVSTHVNGRTRAAFRSLG